MTCAVLRSWSISSSYDGDVENNTISSAKQRLVSWWPLTFISRDCHESGNLLNTSCNALMNSLGERGSSFAYLHQDFFFKIGQLNMYVLYTHLRQNKRVLSSTEVTRLSYLAGDQWAGGSGRPPPPRPASPLVSNHLTTCEHTTMLSCYLYLCQKYYTRMEISKKSL